MNRAPLFISAPLVGATPESTALTTLRVAWLGRLAIANGFAPVMVQPSFPLLFDDYGLLNEARARSWSDALLAAVAFHPAGVLWVLDTGVADPCDRNSWQRLAKHRRSARVLRRGDWDYWRKFAARAGTDTSLVRLHAVLERLPPAVAEQVAIANPHDGLRTP